VPYFITDQAQGCDGWATIKDDGEVIGCHTTKQAAIDQMVAVSIAEGLEPGGERVVETRQVSVPEYVRNAAARGLELRREGFGGDGLTDQTIREARLMADGEMSDSKVVRANAWAARHAVDLEAPKNRDPDHPQWPGAGAVAHYLWGIDPLDPQPARRWLERQVAAMSDERALPDNYRPALEADVPEGRACGNCAFYDDDIVQGDRAWCQRWDEFVRGDYYCNAWQPNPEGNDDDDMDLDDERAVTMSQVEFRTFGAEITEIRQADSGDGMTFGGYAWKYDVPSLPLGHGFTERIAPGAFTRSLKSRVDIRAYVNHNDELLLGSTRAKTLRIEDRADGGWVEIDLPDTSWGRDIRTLVARGDITGMSFGFSTVKDKWSDDGTERTLIAARLHETSVVTGVPAYPQTTASVRKLQTLATRTATDVDELSDAMTALQAGELTEDQAHLLRSVVDKVAPAPDAAVPTAILAAKLALAEKALGL
jgi:HK97 family phage prohead protease